MSESRPVKTTTWKRLRFYEPNVDDPRPVLWPPPGPYWVTGYNDEHAVIVAFMREPEKVLARLAA